MITATVQIVLDVIRHGYMKISDFNLIVFDECHHAQKDHPMLLLMAKFKEVPERDHPRVIGLTGMLTASSVKPQNVLEDLQRLEGTFRAIITTARGSSFSDVLIHSTKPKESVIQYNTNPVSIVKDFTTQKIEELLQIIKMWPLDDTHERSRDPRNEKQPKTQKKLESILKDYQLHLNTLGMVVIFFGLNYEKKKMRRMIKM